MERGRWPQYIRVTKTPCAIQICCPGHYNQNYISSLGIKTYLVWPRKPLGKAHPCPPPIPSGKDKHPHDLVSPQGTASSSHPKAQKDEA